MSKAGIVGIIGLAAAMVIGLTAPEAAAHSGGGGHGGNHGGGYHGGGYHSNNYYRPHYSQWNHNYYGPRCHGWTNTCRYYYGGYWYGNPWWIPVVGTGIAVTSHSSRHVAWCKSHYRSYNPKNNTWVSNSGKVKQCNSPYN